MTSTLDMLTPVTHPSMIEVLTALEMWIWSGLKHPALDQALLNLIYIMRNHPENVSRQLQGTSIRRGQKIVDGVALYIKWSHS